MPRHLSKKPRLLIVTDTAIWKDDVGRIVAFEPVVREIEHFHVLFRNITWIGYLHAGKPSRNAREPNEKISINYVLLKASGGSTFWAKFLALLRSPWYGFIVLYYIFRSDVVHSRSPSLPAFCAICISFFDRKRIYWHKYAGNWKENNPPVFYALQRWLLSKATHTKVTINGSWANQSIHLLNFENPCLSQEEYFEAKSIALKKILTVPLTICFVGNLNRSKGILEFIQALSLIKNKDNIGKILIAGDGPMRQKILEYLPFLSVPVSLTGFLNRQELKKIYSNSHFICLPSHSEGFPKVIAEAAAFGCIPVVSDVSAVSQYIRSGENGWLLPENTPLTIARVLDEAIKDRNKLISIVVQACKLAEMFTYERYRKRIKEELIKT